MKKYVRFEQDGRTGYGTLEGESVLELRENFLACPDGYTGRELPLGSVRLLAPVEAPNVVCIGLNYRRHAAEAGMKLPERPLIFLKTTTALCGPGDRIVLPGIAPDNVDYEGELAVVIGKQAKNVPEEKALDYVFGYTAANDVSARDCQLQLDGQWARGKSFDTFAPIGPAVVSGIDGNRLGIETKLNGTVMQKSTTGDLIFSIEKLVSFVSRNMTLLPGTVILTGTPEGVGYSRNPPVWLREGDLVEITIEQIGTLSNRVAREA